jgi:hypothetical protein
VGVYESVDVVWEHQLRLGDVWGDIGMCTKPHESVQMVVKCCNMWESAQNNAKLTHVSVGVLERCCSVHVGYQTD